MKTFANASTPGTAVPALPEDVRTRAFDYPADLEAFSRLVADVNAFDRHDWFPAAEILGEH
jgi:hypothetical protein